MKTNPQSNALKRARKAAGLTRDELADKIGVSHSTISRWENGGTILEKYRSTLEQILPGTEKIVFVPAPLQTATAKSNSAFAHARVRAGLSQRQLAKKLNVTLWTLKGWENESFPVNAKRYSQLKDLFGDVSGIKFTKTKSALAQARVRAGLSLGKLAEKLGVSAQYVALLENGDKPVPSKYHEQLVKIFGDVSGITFTEPHDYSALAQARIDAGLTQTQLGDAIGVSTVTISYWENGKLQIAPKYRAKLEEALGVELFSMPE